MGPHNFAVRITTVIGRILEIFVLRYAVFVWSPYYEASFIFHSEVLYFLLIWNTHRIIYSYSTVDNFARSAPIEYSKGSDSFFYIINIYLTRLDINTLFWGGISIFGP